jgi:hydrogenase maturation protein HypF
VQHHAAHASALAGEHPDVDNWLVFTWDGVGYGDDGTLWGGEALSGRPGHWQRAASFRTFRLVGGDKAGREPWRSAAALLWDVGAVGEAVGAALAAKCFDFEKGIAAKAAPTAVPTATNTSKSAIDLAHQAWQQNINTFETSAVGRLFDAAAALVLGRGIASFEGQGPMELEHAAIAGCEPVELPIVEDSGQLLRSDWTPLLDVLADTNIPKGERAGIFHETMAQALVDQLLALRKTVSVDAVGLSGGVFQNRFLTERVVDKLEGLGIDVRLHRDVPANDGGLCFGQVMEVLGRKY